MYCLVDLGCMIVGVCMILFKIVRGGRKHSLIPLQNEELGMWNLSIGSRVELIDSESVRD